MKYPSRCLVKQAPDGSWSVIDTDGSVFTHGKDHVTAQRIADRLFADDVIEYNKYEGRIMYGWQG